MADETNAAVNSGNAAGSAPEAGQGQVAVTPAVETNGANQGNADVRIPKARFDEVIGQRNREREMREKYEQEISELRARLPAPAEKNVNDVAVDRLVSRLNLDKNAAQELAEITREIARAERNQVEERLQQYELSGWREELARRYPDYRETEAKMANVWNGMEPHERQIAMKSFRGLEMLYHYAKGQNLPNEVAQAREQGMAQAYESKLAKQAIAGLPGASAKSPAGLTREAIANMSLEEYKTRKEEINEAIRKGTLK